MNKHFLSLYILTTIGFGLHAQEGTIVAADKLYDSKSYADAILKYEKVIKKDSNNVFVLARLGDCYRLTNNNTGQLFCYGKLVEKGTASADQKFYYGKALMGVGRYDDAKKIMEEYSSDDRGKVISKGLANMTAFSKNEDAYKVDTVTFNSTENDFSPIMITSEKIVFTSSRSKSAWISRKHGWTNNNYYNIYVTEKSEGFYSKPTLFMKDLKSKYNSGPICFSKDGNTVYFSRNSADKKTGKSTDGNFKLKIFKAALNIDCFEKVDELPFNNVEYNCAHPALSADGNSLYFASDMPGSLGGMDIWVCKLGADGVWGVPQNVGGSVNTKGNDMFPFITANNLLYFASDGHEGLGGLDIFEVKIKDGKPGKVYNMGKPINSPADDFGITFSEEGKTGFLSSNRSRGGLDDDIFKFDVLRDVKRGKILNLVVKDKDTYLPMEFVRLQINNETVTTNDKGEYQLILEEDANYTYTASKDKYFDTKDSASTKSFPEDEISRNILMEKDPNLSLLAFILDAKSNQALSDVKISIKDMTAATAFDTYTTNATGDYRKPLKGKKIGDKLNFQIMLEKPGYVTKTLNFTHDITKEGEIKLNEVLNLTIGKIEVGMDLAKMIDMKPIYFDLGKSKIRPDAAIELDKVVAAMKEYPNMIIELGAHTDCRSAAAANMKLSTARAKASAAYIISKKIDKTRITGKGYGESKLLNTCACEGTIKPNCPEEEHAKNRRTEFIIVKLK